MNGIISPTHLRFSTKTEQNESHSSFIYKPQRQATAWHHIALYYFTLYFISPGAAVFTPSSVT